MLYSIIIYILKNKSKTQSMKELFAQRLKNARKLAGMSQDNLVSAMDGFVKKTSIAKYERAEMMPGSQVLVALSKALGVLPGYFTKEFNVSVQKLEFRKKKKLGVKELASIKQKAMSILESYLELEELTGSAEPFDHPLSSRLIRNKNDVETAAEELLTAWNLGFNGIYNIFNILEEHGVRLIAINTHEDFDGVSTYANGEIPVIVYNDSYPEDRKRLTVLHELGHLLLHFDSELLANEKRIENLCFLFGGALMMPRVCIYNELGHKRHKLMLGELKLLKRRYGLSVAAIVRRAYELEIINKSFYDSYQYVLRKNIKETGWGEYPVAGHPERFEQLLIRAVAEQVISADKAAELVGLNVLDFISKYQIT